MRKLRLVESQLQRVPFRGRARGRQSGVDPVLVLRLYLRRREELAGLAVGEFLIAGAGDFIDIHGRRVPGDLGRGRSGTATATVVFETGGPGPLHGADSARRVRSNITMTEGRGQCCTAGRAQ